jgi:trans-2,3-dihydro-3-hydroxyanthranilate isomerase
VTGLVWVDVFATGPLSGNQLAVVPEADGLSADQMQAIAREMGLSETIFATAASEPGCDLRFRIFTPARELPMAGHPVVGGAWAMARRGAIGSRAVIQTGVGPLEVTVSEIGAEMVQAAPERMAVPDPEPVAESLGITVAVGRPGGVWSTGLAQLMLPVPSIDDLEAAAPDGAALAALGADQGWIGVSIYAITREGPTVEAAVRHFAPGAGVLEDAATGSAAGALGACLANGIGRDALRLTVWQGAGLGRPAEIRVDVRPGPVVRVGGRVRPVLTATFDGDALA